MPVSFAPFDIARLPRILFGEGRINELPGIVAGFGERVVLVTGASAFLATEAWQRLRQGLQRAGIEWQQVAIADEPSPPMIDQAVAELRPWQPELVLAIGGGSVLDAAKAIAGLLPVTTSVLDHLEGVGRGIPYTGPALPFIAVPTTAGTGSEATKNAVLSERGPKGYKKSFRHDDLVARVALIDPGLLDSCPRNLMAAQGMDAFTQLLESYVSLGANPMTDALTWSGMEAFRDGFFAALDGDAQGRARIAYGSLISGICLAQTGLGSVHGLASPLGAQFPIPHGVVCGTLLAEATDINIQAMGRREPENPALAKYARVGRMLREDWNLSDAQAWGALIGDLRSWVEQLEIPRLGAYGIGESQIPGIVADSRGSSMKTNPLVLDDDDLAQLLRRRL
jgi:alcohol dehydrogenase